MKNFLLLLATIPCLVFCQSEQEEFLPYPLESIEPIEPPSDFVKKKSYVTVGTALLYQKIGAGNRWHNYTKGTGHDISLNTLVFPGVAKVIDSPWTPWLIPIEWDYCYLKYKTLQESADFRYFGIGIGVGGCLVPDLGWWIVPWVNPKIVVGKEYANGRFSQWSLNLIPAACTAICLAREPCEPGFGLLYGMGISLEYSFGF